MGRKAFLTGLVILLVLVVAAPPRSLAAEKVKVGTSAKLFYPYNLLYLATEEKGLWKENGLEAELALLSNATALHQAIAARSIEVGMDPANAALEAAAAGVPFLVVAHLVTKGAGFHLWLKADSPLKEGKELKGGTIGVTALGAASHGYARMMVRALGLEKEIKIVAVGSQAPAMAALKAGKVDGIVLTTSPMANLVAAGEVRRFLSASDYYPRRWLEHVIIVRKDFLDGKPEVMRKTAKVFAEASRLLKENPKWALEKLQGKELQLSAKGAQIVYDSIVANIEFGKIDKEGLENVRNFLVDYGIVAKDKAPPVEAIYRNIFE